jgi:hypothetical protein
VKVEPTNSLQAIHFIIEMQSHTTTKNLEMSDITMCEGTNCPHKEKCHRFTAPQNEYYQAYFAKPPIKEDGTCDFFWGQTQTDIFSQLKEILGDK